MILHFYEDLSDVQAAELLRCRPGTVRSLISRGMTSTPVRGVGYRLR
jgi:DNA-directed RNA polymerase specialized sigma24 family protein